MGNLREALYIGPDCEPVLPERLRARINDAYDALSNLVFDPDFHAVCRDLGERKVRNPLARFAKDTEYGLFDEGGVCPLEQDEWEAMRDICTGQGSYFDDKPSVGANYYNLFLGTMADAPQILQKLDSMLAVDRVLDSCRRTAQLAMEEWDAYVREMNELAEGVLGKVSDADEVNENIADYAEYCATD